VLAGLSRVYDWEALGIDFDPRAIAFAKATYPHLRFSVGSLSDPTLVHPPFDIVLSSAVLEHVPDPLSFLKTERALLCDGGILLSMTPNLEALGFRILRTYWRDLLAPHEHVFLFTASSAEQLCRKAGLRFLGAESVHDPLLGLASLKRCVIDAAGWRVRARGLAYWGITNGAKFAGRVIPSRRGGELLLFAAQR